MHWHHEIPDQSAIAYPRQVVAFLDVLGMRARVLRTATPEKAREQILLLEGATVHRGGYEREGDHEEIRLFSDSMCLAALPTHKGINWLLWRCIFIQGLLLQEGVLVRGGVAMGGHYQSHNVMFSQGLLRSYLLESKLATWPRVIVSEEVVTEAFDYGEMDGQPDGGMNPRLGNC